MGFVSYSEDIQDRQNEQKKIKLNTATNKEKLKGLIKSESEKWKKK